MHQTNTTPPVPASGPHFNEVFMSTQDLQIAAKKRMLDMLLIQSPEDPAIPTLVYEIQILRKEWEI
jgi:hypothetical protein